MLDPKQINPEIPIRLKKQTGSVAVETDTIAVYPKTVGAREELFVKNSQGQEIQITENGVVKLPSNPALVPSGGPAKSVLSKASNTDFAMAWKTINSLMQEFSFVLPAGADLTARINGLEVTGLELSTASAHTPVENEFGTDADTLVLKPASLANIVFAQCIIVEKTATGAVTGQGWKNKAYTNFKANSASTKGAMLGLDSMLDPAKEYLVYVRFLNPSMS